MLLVIRQHRRAFQVAIASPNRRRLSPRDLFLAEQHARADNGVEHGYFDIVLARKFDNPDLDVDSAIAIK